MVDVESLGTVEDVQLTLGDPDGDVYSPAVIERALERARTEVAAEASPGAGEDVLKEAVIALAAWYTYTTSPQETRKEAADVIREWDAASYASYLESNKDDAIDRISSFVFEAY